MSEQTFPLLRITSYRITDHVVLLSFIDKSSPLVAMTHVIIQTLIMSI